MRKKILIISVLIVTTGALLCACAQSKTDQSSEEKTDTAIEDKAALEEPVAIDGGTTEEIDHEAPKKIKSKELTSFLCYYSVMDRDDFPLEGAVTYTFRAELSGDQVKGSYETELEKKEFTADKDFMTRLQKLVDELDLAQYNGIYRKTDGLPEEFGAKLSLKYASGESIYAYNNEDCFLSDEAMLKVEAFFKESLTAD